MSKNKFLYVAAGLIAGFLIGFAFTNSINRRERDDLRAQLERARAPANPASDSLAKPSNAFDETSPRALSEDEIRSAIKIADSRPLDLYLQKNLGLALYSYIRRTPAANYFMPDIARLLKREADANPKDREAILALGNVLFDMAQNDSEPARFTVARAYYEKALALDANDANTRTDLGLTYYFGEPSDPQRAIIEYRRSLSINPRHEAALQNLAAALIKTGQRREAAQRLNELQSVDADNPALSNLRAQLSQSGKISEE